MKGPKKKPARRKAHPAHAQTAKKATSQPLPPLRPEEVAEVRRFLDRRKERVAPPSYVVEQDGNDVVITPQHADRRYAATRLATAFGTTEGALSERLLNQIINAVHLDRSKGLDERDLNAALATIAGIAPRDEIEALLVTQMVATHWLIMDTSRQVGRVNLRPHFQDHGNLTVKLMRTFTAQLEALQRYRGKGTEQKVTVEHVHVHAGGQAIVGAVTSGPGAQAKIEEQAHAKEIAHAPERALRSKDPVLDAVPIARDAERPVPDARREEPRGAEGEPERLEARVLQPGRGRAASRRASDAR
jgi:hypothetical protein